MKQTSKTKNTTFDIDSLNLQICRVWHVFPVPIFEKNDPGSDKIV